MTHVTRSKLAVTAALFMLLLPGVSPMGQATNTIGVADASLEASFYSDASCLLTINTFVQPGKTVIDADVDAEGSRMLIHCDTADGRRLTLLARGDSLNVAQRAPLLSRKEIAEGEQGMIVWLTRSGVNYTDDSAPRRYVIGGSVKLRKSPPADVAGSALNSSRQSFASINGVLESIIKSDGQMLQQNSTVEPLPPLDDTDDAEDGSVNTPEPTNAAPVAAEDDTQSSSSN